MLLEFVMFWMRETLSNIRRNRLMSIVAVSTVTIGLFILGSFYLTLAHLRAAVGNQTEKLDLVVVLQPDVTPERRAEIFAAARIPQVKDLQLAPKAQVLREMQRDMPDIPVDDFRDANPLGDELRIKLHDPQDIFKVRSYLTGITGVQRIRNDDEPVRQLLAVNQFLTVAGFIALFVLGMAILMIIHNAIRLTIFARRREIRIMELVGATAWFIRMPFLLEGIIYGISGALAAAAVLAVLFIAVARAQSDLIRLLLPLTQAEVLWQCVSGMILAGTAFGLAGSWISLSRSIGKATHV